MLFNAYSERTKCPDCKAKIYILQVDFRRPFNCPHCSVLIRVSDVYQKTVRSVATLAAAVIAYWLTSRIWIAVLLWYPLLFVLLFFWYYFGKWWFPPQLVRSPKQAPTDGSVLGLSLTDAVDQSMNQPSQAMPPYTAADNRTGS